MKKPSITEQAFKECLLAMMTDKTGNLWLHYTFIECGDFICR